MFFTHCPESSASQDINWSSDEQLLPTLFLCLGIPSWADLDMACEVYRLGPQSRPILNLNLTNASMKRAKSQPSQHYAPRTDPVKTCHARYGNKRCDDFSITLSSQTTGRIPNPSINNPSPTRCRASAWRIWCRLTLLEYECTFWMRLFSFGGTTECIGADMYHFGDGFIFFGAWFINIGGIYLFGGNVFVLALYRPFE